MAGLCQRGIAHFFSLQAIPLRWSSSLSLQEHYRALSERQKKNKMDVLLPRAWCELGRKQILNGDAKRGLDAMRSGVELFKAHKAQGVHADTELGQIAHVTAKRMLKRDELTAAKTLFLQSIEINEMLGLDRFVAVSCTDVGRICMRQMEYGDGVRYLRKALRINTKHQNHLGMGRVLHDLSLAFRREGNLQLCVPMLQKATDIARELRNNMAPHKRHTMNGEQMECRHLENSATDVLGRRLNDLGNVYYHLGEHDKGRRALQECLELSHPSPHLTRRLVDMGMGLLQEEDTVWEGLMTLEKALEEGTATFSVVWRPSLMVPFFLQAPRESYKVQEKAKDVWKQVVELHHHGLAVEREKMWVAWAKALPALAVSRASLWKALAAWTHSSHLPLEERVSTMWFGLEQECEGLLVRVHAEESLQAALRRVCMDPHSGGLVAGSLLCSMATALSTTRDCIGKARYAMEQGLRMENGIRMWFSLCRDSERVGYVGHDWFAFEERLHDLRNTIGGEVWDASVPARLRQLADMHTPRRVHRDHGAMGWTKSIALLEEALRLHRLGPVHPMKSQAVAATLHRLGTLQRKAGYADKARVSLQSALEIFQDQCPDAKRTLMCHVELGKVWMALGKTEQALDVFHRAVERSRPAIPLAHALLGRAEARGWSGDVKGCIEDLQELYDRQMLSRRVIVRMARKVYLHRKKGGSDRARLMETLCAWGCTTPQGVARAWLSAGDLDRAVATLEANPALSQDNTELWYDVGHAWIGKEEYELGAIAWERAWSMERQMGVPKEERILQHVRLGLAMCKSGRWERGCTLLEEAVEGSAPESREAARAHVELGNALVMSGDVERGVEHLKRGLSLNQRVGTPTHVVRSLRDVGRALKNEQGLEYLRMALRLQREIRERLHPDPHEGLILHWLGRMQVHLGYTDEGIGCMRQGHALLEPLGHARRWNRAVCSVLRDLANVLVDQGQWSEALVLMGTRLMVRESMDRSGRGMVHALQDLARVQRKTGFETESQMTLSSALEMRTKQVREPEKDVLYNTLIEELNDYFDE